MRVVCLAGGVGGAKLADGLQQVLAPGELTVIVNTGDDLERHSLLICPDHDTVMYTLAGIAGAQGWGLAGETWRVMGGLTRLGDRHERLSVNRDVDHATIPRRDEGRVAHEEIHAFDHGSCQGYATISGDGTHDG